MIYVTRREKVWREASCFISVQGVGKIVEITERCLVSGHKKSFERAEVS